MQNYDPNMTSGKMALQTVRMTFQQWEYTAVRTATVGGNCTGLTVIDAAVGNAYDALPEDGRGDPYLILEDQEGNTLQCCDEELDGDDFLKDLLVKAEIVDIHPEDQ